MIFLRQDNQRWEIDAGSTTARPVCQYGFVKLGPVSPDSTAKEIADMKHGPCFMNGPGGVKPRTDLLALQNWGRLSQQTKEPALFEKGISSGDALFLRCELWLFGVPVAIALE